jgi:putative ABC transport system permease protein
MKKDYPEVEDFCRLYKAELLVTNETKQVKFAETKGYFADAQAIKMLNVHLLKGNAGEVLKGVDKMIVSESMAKKYFGDEEPLGKVLTIRSEQIVQHYQVSGVFTDYPANSHLVINYLVSYPTLGKIKRIEGDTTNTTETLWGWYDFYTYIKLKPGVDVKKFEKTKMPQFCWRYYPDLNWAKMNRAHDELYFLPVQDIHLKSNYNEEAEVNGSEGSVNFMFIIALFILGIAWINYINLSTARSVERAKETGIRKVLGAKRNSLIKQFLTESLLLNTASLLLAFITVLALTPVFNTFTGHVAAPSLFTLPGNFWLLFFGIFAAGTLLSGLYPAFVLSAYQPVKVLKGAFKNAAGGLLLRKALIVLQFATSIILIAGTLTVYRQMQYMQQRQLGFNINQTLVLTGSVAFNDSTYTHIYQPFKTEMLRIPGVQSVAGSSTVMGKEITWTNDLKRMGSNDKTYTAYNLGIDYDFIPSFNMRMAAGRNFSKEHLTDNRTAILNESAAKMLGYKNAEEALNTKVVEAGNDTLNIIGVLADFHYMGLQKQIDPQLIMLRPDTCSNYSIKIISSNMPQTVEAVKKVWSNFFPSEPFNYFFLDDFYNRQYGAAILFGRVFGLFALLAILIACFGLSGLSAYNILQRTKEIGIRKVMGASINNLMVLLTKDFMLLVLLAFVIATPVSWWVMDAWLQSFAYRTSVSAWVFLLAGITAGIIALATVALQAIKAAIVSPVTSLRAE